MNADFQVMRDCLRTNRCRVASVWQVATLALTIATVQVLYYRPVVANLGAEYRWFTMINPNPQTPLSQTYDNAVRKPSFRSRMRLGLIAASAFIALLLASPAQATTVYFSQSGGSASCGADGTQTTVSVASLNSSGWGGAGTTYQMCGVISTPITLGGSGTAASPITMHWETGAKMSAPNWGPDPDQFDAAPAISGNGSSYWVFDGGGTGVIEATSNGTGLATQYDNTGLNLLSCNGCTIENLTISDMYVHTCTLPVSNCTDENGGLSGGIYITDGSNITITNVTAHDMKWGLFYSTDSGSWSNIQIYGNTVYRVDHGLIVAEGDPNITVNGVYIHDNTVHDLQNWDDAGNGNHHDGLHSWSYNSGDALNNLEIYNNYFYGDVGYGFNAWLYEEGVALHAAYFNNLLVDTAGDASAGCGYICLGDSGGVAMYVFNNTVIGFNLTDNTGISSYSGGDAIENNALSTMYKFTAPNSNTPAAWDYNNYSNAGGCGWDCGTTFAGWQANGFDLHGSYASPNFNGSYQPTSTSTALIQKGVNLTSYGITALNSDKAGTARPSSGAWTIGAYQSSGSGSASNPPNPPTGLAAVVQ